MVGIKKIGQGQELVPGGEEFTKAVKLLNKTSIGRKWCQLKFFLGISSLNEEGAKQIVRSVLARDPRYNQPVVAANTITTSLTNTSYKTIHGMMLSRPEQAKALYKISRAISRASRDPDSKMPIMLTKNAETYVKTYDGKKREVNENPIENLYYKLCAGEVKPYGDNKAATESIEMTLDLIENPKFASCMQRASREFKNYIKDIKSENITNMDAEKYEEFLKRTETFINVMKPIQNELTILGVKLDPNTSMNFLQAICLVNYREATLLHAIVTAREETLKNWPKGDEIDLHKYPLAAGTIDGALSPILANLIKGDIV